MEEPGAHYVLLFLKLACFNRGLASRETHIDKFHAKCLLLVHVLTGPGALTGPHCPRIPGADDESRLHHSGCPLVKLNRTKKKKKGGEKKDRHLGL